MPNIPQQQTIVQYVANASQFNYTFAFYAPLPTDIQVYYQAPTATPIPSSDILAINSQYTVTYNSDPTTGGFITLLFTPITGYYLTINRMVAASLNTTFALAQNFNGENLDAALDRLLLLIQQNLNYITQRNLSYIINTYLPNAVPFTQLPPLAQNQIWIGSGSGVVAVSPLAVSPSAAVLQAMLANNSPGTDGARLVGFYDNLHSNATTVHDFLENLSTNIESFTATDTGSANALAIAITYPNFVLTEFQMFLVEVANTNTGASTISINSGSPINIVDGQGNAMTNNEMVVGQMAVLIYDGINMQLINPNKIYYGGSLYMATTQTIALSSAATVNFSNANINPVGLVSVSNNGFVINRAGYYRVNLNVLCAIASSTGSCFASLNKNAILQVRLANIPYITSSNSIVLAGSAVILCAVNDIINVIINNTSSANALSVGSTGNPQLSNLDIEYLGS